MRVKRHEAGQGRGHRGHGKSGDARLLDERHHFGLVKEDNSAIHLVSLDPTGVGPSEDRFGANAAARGECSRLAELPSCSLANEVSVIFWCDVRFHSRCAF